ncbi:MAG TPA: DUF192 domain-containing protein [Holophaga sp.]|nr:DUF192 domain-containing protein [Holophaga sp.]
MTPFLLSLLLAATGTPDGGSVVVKGQTFLAEVAATPREQERGLMYRSSLQPDHCMIFIYPEEGYHSIWMKNCLISLDVAWVKEDGTVVETAERVPPCSPMMGNDCPAYGGTKPARHFVEFPAGTFKRLGLKTGDRIGWSVRLADGAVVEGGLRVPAEGAKAKVKRKASRK